jgi:hypothetical protein
MPATVCVAIPGTTIVSSAAAVAPGVNSAAAAAPGVISVVSADAAVALIVVSSTAAAALLVVSSAAALLVVSSTAAAALIVVSSAFALLVVSSTAGAALLVVSSAVALLVVSSAAAADLLVVVLVVFVVVVALVSEHLRSSNVPDRLGGGSVATKCKLRHIRHPADEVLLMFPLRLVPLHNVEAAMQPVAWAPHGCTAARPRSLPCEPDECTLWQVNCYLRQNGYRIEYCLSHGLKTYQAHQRGPTHKDFLEKYSDRQWRLGLVSRGVRHCKMTGTHRACILQCRTPRETNPKGHWGHWGPIYILAWPYHPQWTIRGLSHGLKIRIRGRWFSMETNRGSQT